MGSSRWWWWEHSFPDALDWQQSFQVSANLTADLSTPLLVHSPTFFVAIFAKKWLAKNKGKTFLKKSFAYKSLTSRSNVLCRNTDLGWSWRNNICRRKWWAQSPSYYYVSNRRTERDRRALKRGLQKGGARRVISVFPTTSCWPKVTVDFKSGNIIRTTY